jgi:hypothetical protein
MLFFFSARVAKKLLFFIPLYFFFNCFIYIYKCDEPAISLTNLQVNIFRHKRDFNCQQTMGKSEFWNTEIQ